MLEVGSAPAFLASGVIAEDHALLHSSIETLVLSIEKSTR